MGLNLLTQQDHILHSFLNLLESPELVHLKPSRWGTPSILVVQRFLELYSDFRIIWVMWTPWDDPLRIPT